MDVKLIIYIIIVLKVLRKPYVKRDRNYKRRSRIIMVGIFSFLLYYKKCAKIFFNIEINKFFLFKKDNYVFNLINDKEPLYNFFYNLL